MKILKTTLIYRYLIKLVLFALLLKQQIVIRLKHIVIRLKHIVIRLKHIVIRLKHIVIRLKQVSRYVFHILIHLPQILRAKWTEFHTHIAPPEDSYYFAVPFDYQVSIFTPQSVAVICHLYYPDMLEEFKRYLLNVPFAFDLFITTDTEEKRQLIQQGLLEWQKGKVEVRLAPNRGRDIAPKFLTCRDVYERYEFFLHIHSKKSLHADSLLEGWRLYILKTLLGSEAIVQSIFEAFNSDERLGIIAPEHFKPLQAIIGWGRNFKAAEDFARNKLGIKLSLESKIDFPSGSMFWARSAAIKPLLDLNLLVEDFQPEKKQIDGTLAHIIERLYFFICEQAGYRWIKIAIPTLIDNNDRTIWINNQHMLVECIKQTQYAILQSNSQA